MITEVEIKALGRELKDFDIYDAAQDTEAAWAYLIKIAEAGKEDPYFAQLIARTKSLTATIKSNYRRWKSVSRQLLGETEENAYKDIYKAERALLETYCYAALGDYFAEKYPDQLAKVVAEIKEENEQKKAESRKKREMYRAKYAVRFAQQALEAAEIGMVDALEVFEVHAAKAVAAQAELDKAISEEAAKGE